MLNSNSIQGSEETAGQNKYKGVRCRKWGKWVSEIRVPGTKERLWLGSYSTPEAAAVAHDVASYCLRGPSSADSLNFPLMLPASVKSDMSPKSIQRAASDAGMAIDAQMIINRSSSQAHHGVVANESGSVRGIETEFREDGEGSSRDWERKESREEEQGLSISVEDYFF